MAYKALYRTYRPRNFDEVAGQKHVVQTLKNAVEQNKIAHAYLFCGPRGTGKTSIAKIFAKLVNCEGEHKPCLQCSNCLGIQEGTHPDVIEIDAASNNGVDEVRSLIEKVKYAPIKGKYKVYIIDEVHMMSTGAFNALLKTIEEPPAHVIFILATTEPHKVLPTIISRCQRFDFTKVSNKEIHDRIMHVLDNEKIICDEQVVDLIAELADGGLRDALSILDQCIAYANDDIQLHHINEIYGITTVDEKLKLLGFIFDNNPKSLMDELDVLYQKGIDIKRLTADFIELLKESILFEYTKDESLLSKLQAKQALLLMERKTSSARFKMIHLLMDASEKYKFATNISSYFEICLMEMMSVKVENTVQVSENTSVEVVKPTTNVSRETSVQQNHNEEKTVIEAEKIKNKTNVAKQTTQNKAQTSEAQPNKIEIKPLDNDFIIGLFQTANKDIKAHDMEKFNKINNYVIDFKYARLARLLQNISLVACSTNFMIVGTDSIAEANEINEIDQQNGFYDFMIELVGTNKKVIAITKEQEHAAKLEFVNRRKTGTLPPPRTIDDVVIEKEVVKELTQEEVIVQLFGEENIDIQEE